MTTPIAGRGSQRRCCSGESAVERGKHELGEIGFEPHHDRLRFRIAETHVELDDLRRAVAADHEAGVEEPGERRAFGGHAGEGRHG